MDTGVLIGEAQTRACDAGLQTRQSSVGGVLALCICVFAAAATPRDVRADCRALLRAVLAWRACVVLGWATGTCTGTCDPAQGPPDPAVSTGLLRAHGQQQNLARGGTSSNLTTQD